MGIYISPKNANLTGWSFYDFIPRPGVKFNEQDTYFIYFSYGLNLDTDYTFYLDFLVCNLQNGFGNSNLLHVLFFICRKKMRWICQLLTLF